MDMKLRMTSKAGSRETAQAAYDGARYYRTDNEIYLKDFGRGGSDDSAKLYSGQMLDFDGVDDDVITNQFAVNGLQFTRIMTIKTSNSFRVGWNVNGGTTERFYIGQGLVGLGDIYAEHGLTIKDGNYHRIVLIRDGDTGKVYLDGVLRFSFTGCGLTEWTSLKVYFGSYSHGTSRFVDGFLGNVQIWNAAFDADDVEYDYANCYQNLTADNRPGTSLTADNLKGHWPLIESSGDVAYDWSGNGNHGTLTNFPTDDSQWSNASALDSPLVIQTALCEWGYADGVVCPLGTIDVSRTVNDESFTSNYDTAISLAHSNLTSGSVTVTTTDGATTYTEGSDYIVDYVNGTVTVLSTGTMADATEYYIAYDYKTDAIDFTRNYSELNFNARSYADCGNGSDVNPSTALIVELVILVKSCLGVQYVISCDNFLYIYQEGDIPTVLVRTAGGEDYSSIVISSEHLTHIVIAYNSNTKTIYRVVDGIITEESLSTTDAVLKSGNYGLKIFSNRYNVAQDVAGQLPLFKIWTDSEAQAIIDDDLDAWVAKRYAKAKAKYNL